uniref:ADP,ATP carrier protein n=1 Tax=Odontella aurita TaxID=265563 RepID=A0A7S4NE59_9STRA|mmetsp:Transcript_60410/g.178937  ORF Transcript_60410/g.178937 Transcript_60410/m.178937 type:complete len:380 (+) Transcript_60410:147-1286(+)|eukprot:CAMPEP_0113581344 /NCGR_PEP_ID=MMETSP0015_2-20120614/31234_1 /TAXON_ID=2838 /ORGANISM="Odontella" /LENGTH=379 /DNA_ID=CAMNT_0000485749 /DNA_START=52 /DNA_END=1191 /DNA_ORIENTATION=+ /assembly_acc=CAM_ASM_000160
MSNESIVAEVVAASVGGAFSASALYPLEMLKTRMQAETKVKKKKGGANEKQPEETAEIASSSADDGEGEEGAIPVPSSDEETEPTRQKQAAHKKGKNAQPEDRGEDDEDEQEAPLGMIPYARKMHAEGGIGAFYSGIETSAIQSAMEKSLYFFAYTFLKNAYKTLTGLTSIDTIPNLVLGSLAEWAHLPVTLPIDCLTTAIQTDKTGRGAFALMSAMLSEKGVGGMYKGIQAYAVLCLKPAIQYTVYEQVKRMVLLERRLAGHHKGNLRHGSRRGDDVEALSAAEAFFLGMFARTVATMITFPYVRAKVMLQSTYAERGLKGGIPAMIVEMYGEGGLSEVFQGLGPELTRGIFSAALMMMAKEKLAVVVNALVGAQKRM